MVGGAALLAAAAVFYAVNYPAAVSTAATTRQLPIYSVERAQKVCAISFDAAWGEGKVRHGCREREHGRAINACGIRLSSLNTRQEKAAKSPCRRFCSFLRLLLPSINKSRHGFDGQKCAHLSGLSLPVVFCPPVLSSPLSGGWDSAVFRSIKERGQLINLLEYTDAYFLGTSPSKLINENARIRTIPLFGLENEPVTVLLGQQNYTLHRNAQRFVDIFRQVTENI